MSTIVGAIYQITDTQEFGANNFKKREVIVKTIEEYPQHVKIEFLQGNTSLPELYQEGDNVKISYNLRGRLYEKEDSVEVYNSVVGWKIERV